MRSRAIIPVLFWLGCAVSVRAADAQANFLVRMFSAVPPEQKLSLSRETAAEAGRIRRGSYSAVPYWREGKTSVWVLQTRAKTGFIKTIFAVREGKILAGEVLQFQEHLGQQVCSPGFLKQFCGAALRDDRQLDREIDGIMGAMLTTGAMRDMARLAIFFDSQLPPAPE